MAYVDRESIKLEVRRYLMPNVDFDGTVSVENAERYFLKLLDDEPTADVEEVRHGFWEEYWDDNYLSWSHKCSKCGAFPLTKDGTMHDEVLSAYCPHCGARMDGGKDENV